MRRALKRMIPVFALALLVQLLSPIGAIRFVAAAAIDPLAAVQLCSAMAAEQGDVGASGLPHTGGCCTICAVGLGGAPTHPAPAPAVSVIAASYQPLAWAQREEAPPVLRPSAHAQPRGPPRAG